MTPADIIAQARLVLNDTLGPDYRWSDATLLVFVNDFMKALSGLKPQLFHEVSTLTLVAGSHQTVSRETTRGLVMLLENAAGDALRPKTLDDLNGLSIKWRSVTGAIEVWAPLADAWSFVVYPKAVAGDTVKAVVSKIPADAALADTLTVSDSYRAAGGQYVAGRALTMNTSVADVQKGAALVQSAITMAEGVRQ